MCTTYTVLSLARSCSCSSRSLAASRLHSLVCCSLDTSAKKKSLETSSKWTVLCTTVWQRFPFEKTFRYNKDLWNAWNQQYVRYSVCVCVWESERVSAGYWEWVVLVVFFFRFRVSLFNPFGVCMRVFPLSHAPVARCIHFWPLFSTALCFDKQPTNTHTHKHTEHTNCVCVCAFFRLYTNPTWHHFIIKCWVAQ